MPNKKQKKGTSSKSKNNKKINKKNVNSKKTTLKKKNTTKQSTKVKTKTKTKAKPITKGKTIKKNKPSKKTKTQINKKTISKASAKKKTIAVGFKQKRDIIAKTAKTSIKKNTIKPKIAPTPKEEIKQKDIIIEEQIKTNNSILISKPASSNQESTLDIIKAAAMKIAKNKPSDEQNKNNSDYMEILTPRKRGRPPRSERRNSPSQPHIYEPEVDGIIGEAWEKKANTDTQTSSSSYANDNEVIDFWTDDDIPIASSWKEDLLDF